MKLLIALALTFLLAAQQGITRNQADDQNIIGLDQPAPQEGSLLADPQHPDRVMASGANHVATDVKTGFSETTTRRGERARLGPPRTAAQLPDCGSV